MINQLSSNPMYTSDHIIARSVMNNLDPELTIKKSHDMSKPNKSMYGIKRNPKRRYKKVRQTRTKFSRTKTAAINHEIFTERGKFVEQPNVKGIIENKPETLSQQQKNSSAKKITDHIKEKVVKAKTASAPVIRNAFTKGKGVLKTSGKQIGDIFKGRKGFMLQATAIVGSVMLASKIVTGQNEIRRPYSNTVSFDRRAAYLPATYKEGYKDIKESLTDFGSRVNLDKTVTRVNVTPPSNTRHGMTTNTNTVMNSNVALNLANNAINHTRY